MKKILFKLLLQGILLYFITIIIYWIVKLEIIKNDYLLHILLISSLFIISCIYLIYKIHIYVKKEYDDTELCLIDGTLSTANIYREAIIFVFFGLIYVPICFYFTAYYYSPYINKLEKTLTISDVMKNGLRENILHKFKFIKGEPIYQPNKVLKFVCPPSKVSKDTREKISIYIASGMKGEEPQEIISCKKCHGVNLDGYDKNYHQTNAPSLKKERYEHQIKLTKEVVFPLITKLWSQ